MLDQFSVITSDPDPMHVDPKWAEEHGAHGGTISFGFLTLSLITAMMHSSSRAQHPTGAVAGNYYNYGFDRVRFVSPVRVGSRVRGHFTVSKVEERPGGRRHIHYDCSVEIEGQSRPAVVAEWISVWIPT
jgi:acyl dehydratase